MKQDDDSILLERAQLTKILRETQIAIQTAFEQLIQSPKFPSKLFFQKEKFDQKK